jgi:catalase (peroxidase I)
MIMAMGTAASFKPLERASASQPLLSFTASAGGLRVLGANARKSRYGVFTKRPETLTNDFFVDLLDMGTQWQPSAGSEGVCESRDQKTDELKWTGTRVDLIFGSHSQSALSRKSTPARTRRRSS